MKTCSQCGNRHSDKHFVSGGNGDQTNICRACRSDHVEERVAPLTDRLLRCINTGDRRWVKYAACDKADHGLFFKDRGESIKEAREICKTCPARIACLRYAIDNHIRHGIWGGTSERERIAIRRNLKKKQAAA